MRAALGSHVHEVSSTYCAPLSNTGGAVMLLEPDLGAVQMAAE